MAMKEDLYKELDILKINLNESNIEYIVNILSKIVFINRNDYKVLALFTKITNECYLFALV